MNFAEVYKRFWTKGFNFSSRATRTEYWLVCPKCNGTKAFPRKETRYECASCGYCLSVTTGTVMHKPIFRSPNGFLLCTSTASHVVESAPWSLRVRLVFDTPLHGMF